MCASSDVRLCVRLRVCVILQAVPSVLEIPSKDHPYEPAQDSLLKRVKHIMGQS